MCGAAPAPLSYYAALLRSRCEFSEQRCFAFWLWCAVYVAALLDDRSINRKQSHALIDGQERPRPAHGLTGCALLVSYAASSREVS